MPASRYLLLLAACVFIAAPLYSQTCSKNQPANCAYVANHTDGEILGVDRNTGSITSIHDLTKNPNRISGALPEDVTVCPDDRIYAALPANGMIVRLKRDGSQREIIYNHATAVAPHNPTGPQGVRCDHKGNLIFSTVSPGSTGIWRIAGAAFTTLAQMPAPQNIIPAGAFPAGSVAPNGQGLAFLHNGGLLIADRDNNRVLVSPQNAPDPDPVYGAVSVLLENLDSPTGIVVDRRGEIFVSNGGATNSVQRFSAGGALIETYATFPVDGVNQRPNYLEVVADNTMFVNTTDSTFSKGLVFRIPPITAPVGSPSVTPATPTLLAAMPKSRPAASGIGVGGTSMTITKEFSLSPGQNTQVYDFGPVQAEFASDVDGTCDLAITMHQLPPASLNQQLLDNGINATMIAMFSEQGWINTFEGSKPSCFMGDTAVFIAGFYAVTATPRTARFSGNFAELLDLIGFYPLVLAGGEFGDPGTTSGTRGDWSSFGLVNAALQQVNNQDVFFCGFESPLVDNADVTNAPSMKLGRNVTVKFRLSTNPACTDSFIESSRAVFAAARVFGPGGLTEPAFDRVNITPSGSSVPVAPEFKFDSGDSQHSFTWSTSSSTFLDGSSLLPGFYQIIATTNETGVATTMIQLTP